MEQGNEDNENTYGQGWTFSFGPYYYGQNSTEVVPFVEHDDYYTSCYYHTDDYYERYKNVSLEEDPFYIKERDDLRRHKEKYKFYSNLSNLKGKKGKEQDVKETSTNEDDFQYLNFSFGPSYGQKSTEYDKYYTSYCDRTFGRYYGRNSTEYEDYYNQYKAAAQEDLMKGFEDLKLSDEEYFTPEEAETPKSTGKGKEKCVEEVSTEEDNQDWTFSSGPYYGQWSTEAASSSTSAEYQNYYTNYYAHNDDYYNRYN